MIGTFDKVEENERFEKFLKKRNMLNTHIFFQLLKTANINEPVAEYKFDSVRKWRFDYAWIKEKLALEVEGGVWMSAKGKKSRHFTGKGALADMEKYNHAASLGWRIIRVTPQQLFNQKTIQLINKSLLP